MKIGHRSYKIERQILIAKHGKNSRWDGKVNFTHYLGCDFQALYFLANRGVPTLKEPAGTGIDSAENGHYVQVFSDVLRTETRIMYFMELPESIV